MTKDKWSFASDCDSDAGGRRCLPETGNCNCNLHLQPANYDDDDDLDLRFNVNVVCCTLQLKLKLNQMDECGNDYLDLDGDDDIDD